MEIKPGDVIAAQSPTASKRKFHLCVVGVDERGVAQFLFINSEYKFESDLRLSDGEIGGLPDSRTGETVISFSDIVRFRADKLRLWQATYVTTIDKGVAGKVIAHVRTVPTLRISQINAIVNALETLTE